MEVDKKLELLMVDDEKDILDFLQEVASSKFNVEHFDDPRKAVNRIKEKKFDIVVTDLYMPYYTGIDISLAVKQYQENVPVILITAYAEKDPRLEQPKTYGISHVLQKPFGLDAFKQLLYSLVSIKD